jgi:hypothetical protein
VPKLGQNLKVRRGERHVPVQAPDLNNASLTARRDIDKAIQLGGVNDIDLGNVSQTVSAVWISEQTSIRSKFEEPRLQALAAFYQQSHRMLIDQAQKVAVDGAEASLGKTGRKQTYDVRSFGSPKSYTIEYQYMTKSRKQEVANLAMAGAARGLLPLKNILTDILLVEDPDGLLRQLEVEEARQRSGDCPVRDGFALCGGSGEAGGAGSGCQKSPVHDAHRAGLLYHPPA